MQKEIECFPTRNSLMYCTTITKTCHNNYKKNKQLCNFITLYVYVLQLQQKRVCMFQVPLWRLASQCMSSVSVRFRKFSWYISQNKLNTRTYIHTTCILVCNQIHFVRNYNKSKQYNKYNYRYMHIINTQQVKRGVLCFV